MGNKNREGSALDLRLGALPCFPLSVPCRGTLGGGFRVTVWVLSWIYKFFFFFSGGHFMSFSPPFCSPLHHPQSSPFLSFQVTQSLHCTQGVVITGAAEIGQDKGTLPAQDVFLLFFLSSSTSPLLSSHVLPRLLVSFSSFSTCKLS